MVFRVFISVGLLLNRSSLFWFKPGREGDLVSLVIAVEALFLLSCVITFLWLLQSAAIWGLLDPLQWIVFPFPVAWRTCKGRGNWMGYVVGCNVWKEHYMNFTFLCLHKIAVLSHHQWQPRKKLVAEKLFLDKSIQCDWGVLIPFLLCLE